MLKSMGSAVFYARFFSRFSALGYRQRERSWVPLKYDFSGQTWAITGATGGIGRAIALVALRSGARVLAIGRNADKLDALKLEANSKNLLTLQADLASSYEVRRLSAQVHAVGGALTVLVNNVGVLLNEFSLNAEGVETSFASNLLNHFVLTEALLERKALQADSLVINMSSGGMYGMALKLAEMAPLSARDYDGMAAYAMHKRAQVELTRAWNARWNGAPLAYVMHPGWVDTDGVQRSLPLFRAALKRFLRDAEQGADTAIWLAQERPPIEPTGGIWLDRTLEAEHAFAFTRKTPHDARDLYDFLAAKSPRQR